METARARTENCTGTSSHAGQDDDMTDGDCAPGKIKAWKHALSIDRRVAGVFFISRTLRRSSCNHGCTISRFTFEVHVRGVMQSCPCDRTRLKISGDNPAHFQLRRLMVCRRSFSIRHKYRRLGSYDETRLATALRHSHSSQGHDSIKLWPR